MRRKGQPLRAAFEGVDGKFHVFLTRITNSYETLSTLTDQ